jgi:hypothetical protein
MRNESEILIGRTPGVYLSWSHYRPILTSFGLLDLSKSMYVGTRKMVNYA